MLTFGPEEIFPAAKAFRIPAYESSSPRSILYGNTFMGPFFFDFLARESTETQMLASAVQRVPIDHRPKVCVQLGSLKRLGRSLASTHSETHLAAIMVIGFARNLEEGYLD